MATNGSMQRKENSAFHDPGYDRNAVKLRTPIEVTLKGAGTYAKGKGPNLHQICVQHTRSRQILATEALETELNPEAPFLQGRNPNGVHLPASSRVTWYRAELPTLLRRADLSVSEKFRLSVVLIFICSRAEYKTVTRFPCIPGRLAGFADFGKNRGRPCDSAEYRKANSERSERSVSPKRGKTKRKKQSVRPDVSETQMADLPSEEQLPEEEAAETRDIFPKPDEVPRPFEHCK
eukprot:g8093.t1